jgi:hypothetical protein
MENNKLLNSIEPLDKSWSGRSLAAEMGTKGSVGSKVTVFTQPSRLFFGAMIG